MQHDVIRNAKRNIVWGVLNKLIVMLCPFFTKTMVKLFLGTQYLGMDSLFSSIISVLSLSELGLSSAIVYHLYQPVTKGQTKDVNAILNFYKKAYRVIGVAIMVLGIIVIPFLPELIKGSYPEDIVLWKTYLIFLSNTSLSYFMYAYLTPLLTVLQRNDILSRINSAITILINVARLGVLLIVPNYYIYILLTPLFTIVNNLWMAYVIKKRFPEYKCEGQVSKETVEGLKTLISGTFIQKACSITRNSLDSVCVSAFLGLTLTAVYNNYFYISHSVTAFMNIVITAFAGGIGRHVVQKSPDENFEEFKKLDFIYLWTGGWCTICLLCLYQPFMTLWMGEEMLLAPSSVILFALYFYLLKLGDTRSIYNSANGLWWEQRWRSIAETTMNVVLNIVLGYFWGINGIISATIVSLFLCNYVWATRITFEKYFDKAKLRFFYSSQFKYTMVTLFAALATYAVCMLINCKNTIIVLLIRVIICVIIPNVMYYVIYRKTTLFRDAIQTILKRK